MRSGIGPEEVLARLGAAPVSVLPGVANTNLASMMIGHCAADVITS